jgi:hypothetical protein
MLPYGRFGLSEIHRQDVETVVAGDEGFNFGRP